MNFHLKKLTALLLAALLIVSVFPAAALAAPNIAGSVVSCVKPITGKPD